MGFQKVEKVVEHQWRLKTSLIFRPISQVIGVVNSSVVFDFRNSGNEIIWENSKIIHLVMKNSQFIYKGET